MTSAEERDPEPFHIPTPPPPLDKGLTPPPPHQMDGEPYYTAMEYAGQTGGAFQADGQHGGELAPVHLHADAAALELDPQIMGPLRDEFALGYAGMHDGGGEGGEFDDGFHMGDVGRGRKWEG